MKAMVVGLVVGAAMAWWFGAHAENGTLLPLLPSAEALAIGALAVLAAGWLLATVAPRLTAGIALGAMPGVVYASVVLDRVDHARATSLLGTVAALTGLGIGCAMQAYKMPKKRRRRFPPRPRAPKVARH